jgi:hypothetical protein
MKTVSPRQSGCSGNPIRNICLGGAYEAAGRSSWFLSRSAFGQTPPRSRNTDVFTGPIAPAPVIAAVERLLKESEALY